MEQHKLLGTSPILFPDEWSLQSDQLSDANPLLGPLTGVCPYLSLSLGQESLWSCVGHSGDCLHTARPVALPSVGFIQEDIGKGGSSEAHS